MTSSLKTLDLSDIRTGSGDSVEVMAETIAAVRVVEVFSPAYHSPLKTLRELEWSLGSCSLEGDRLILKSDTDARSFVSTAVEDRSFQEAAEESYREF